jgi:hypothetical protein
MNLLSCRDRAAQQPFDFLPERLPHLSLGLEEAAELDGATGVVRSDEEWYSGGHVGLLQVIDLDLLSCCRTALDRFVENQ